MKADIVKVCADSLRTFSKEQYDIKLQATHAHELVAAYMGYKCKNGLLADKEFPVSNFPRCEIIVMMQDSFIDLRRNCLSGLPSGLPDSYSLGEAVYGALFDDRWWSSPYPPFRNLNKMALHLVQNNPAYQSVFRPSFNLPSHHVVESDNTANSVFITVTHAHKASDGKLIGCGQTTINLPRLAGRIGFGTAQISVGQWVAGARKVLGYEGGRHEQ